MAGVARVLGEGVTRGLEEYEEDGEDLEESAAKRVRFEGV